MNNGTPTVIVKSRGMSASVAASNAGIAPPRGARERLSMLAVPASAPGFAARSRWPRTAQLVRHPPRQLVLAHGAARHRSPPTRRPSGRPTSKTASATLIAFERHLGDAALLDALHDHTVAVQRQLVAGRGTRPSTEYTSRQRSRLRHARLWCQRRREVVQTVPPATQSRAPPPNRRRHFVSCSSRISPTISRECLRG